jgi:hypothetical protein
MRILLSVAQLAISAAIASAAGGLFLIALFCIGGLIVMLASGPAEAVRAIPDAVLFLLLFAGVAVAGTIFVAFVPALLVGALLVAVGRAQPWARSRRAWAMGGAATALGVYAWALNRMTGHGFVASVEGGETILPVACILSGMAAGLAYCAALGATAPFFGVEDEDEA